MVMLPCPTCGHDNPEWARFCGDCGVRQSHELVDPLVGQTLAERYRILRPIGAGAMGRVYLAEQSLGRTRRHVAVKVLSDEMRTDPELIARFHFECAAMASLDHPNTVRIFDFGELATGTPYLVMEHVEGEPLSAVLERGPLPLPRVQRIVAQIAGSLHQAHERGIVHRDLKPDNVILVDDAPSEDFLKVLDFGIAKQIGQVGKHGIEAELTSPGTILGTPQYMAPEQFAGDEVDRRTDVYALGVMAYEMIAGRLPFEADSPLEWATRHLHEPPTPLDETVDHRPVRPEVREAIGVALSKRRIDRQATVLELAEQLAFPSAAPGLAPHGSGPQPQARPSVPAPPVKTSYGALGLAALLVLLVGGGLVVWSTTMGDDDDASRLAAEGGDVAEEPDPSGGSVDTVSQDGPSDSPWLESLHHVRNASDAQEALGPADGSYATIDPGGMITLDAGEGRVLVGDGTEASDLTVHVDESRSGTYRLDAGLDHHDLLVLDESAAGVTRVDLDRLAPGGARFVRVWNRDRSRSVYLDAVGGLRIEEEEGGDPRAKP